MKKALLFSVFGFLLLSASASFADDGANALKLDQVLQNQNQILQKLDEIKSELQIVKVRASSRV